MAHCFQWIEALIALKSQLSHIYTEKIDESTTIKRQSPKNDKRQRLIEEHKESMNTMPNELMEFENDFKNEKFRENIK